ncbi:MAG: Chromate resistance protein ChrB [Planctomycetaceae bacterium]
MRHWLLLTYKIPREPSARRVYVWRQMKQLGAVSLQDAVWVLPASDRTRERFQWLAAEITELGGEATLWTADAIYATDEPSLRAHFEKQVDSVYADILAALKRKQRNLAELSKRYQQIQSKDYFHSPLGEQVRAKLLAAHSARRKDRGDSSP